MALASAGAIGGQLLAIDHPDVEDRLINPLAVWDFTAEDGLAFTIVDIQIRYDDLLASLEGIDENDLKLFHFVDDDWVDITTGIDTILKILSADGVSSFSQFAVATAVAPPIPEPSSLLLLGGLALGLVRRRRPNQRRAELQQ